MNVLSLFGEHPAPASMIYEGTIRICVDHLIDVHLVVSLVLGKYVVCMYSTLITVARARRCNNARYDVP